MARPLKRTSPLSPSYSLPPLTSSNHIQGQYVDGLRAPLLIHPPSEKYTYDAEYSVILGDWYHDEHSVLINQFINIANPGGAEPVPSAGLVYFAQGGTYLGPIDGTFSGVSGGAVGFNENATLPFEVRCFVCVCVLGNSGSECLFVR